MNLVFRHPSGGCLYQGNKKDSLDVYGLDQAGIKVVVFAAFENNKSHLPDRFDVIRARLGDVFFPNQAQADHIESRAEKVADVTAFYLANGFNVLSTCAAGWIRSGLVSGFTLVKCGVPGEQAIQMIRRARGPMALGNPAFRSMILNRARRSRSRVA